MRFLHALAWVALVWSILAIAIPIVFIGTETNPVRLAVRQMHFQTVLPLRGIVFVVSTLWLMFG